MDNYQVKFEKTRHIFNSRTLIERRSETSSFYSLRILEQLNVWKISKNVGQKILMKQFSNIPLSLKLKPITVGNYFDIILSTNLTKKLSKITANVNKNNGNQFNAHKIWNLNNSVEKKTKIEKLFLILYYTLGGIGRGGEWKAMRG